MQTAAIHESSFDYEQEDFDYRDDCEIVEITTAGYTGESLYFAFVNEIDAWARHALSTNGFGDF